MQRDATFACAFIASPVGFKPPIAPGEVVLTAADLAACTTRYRHIDQPPAVYLVLVFTPLLVHFHCHSHLEANLSFSCARRRSWVPLGLVSSLEPVRYEWLYRHNLKYFETRKLHYDDNMRTHSVRAPSSFSWSGAIPCCCFRALILSYNGSSGQYIV